MPTIARQCLAAAGKIQKRPGRRYSDATLPVRVEIGTGRVVRPFPAGLRGCAEGSEEAGTGREAGAGGRNGQGERAANGGCVKNLLCLHQMARGVGSSRLKSGTSGTFGQR